jgi:uncharacterized protein with FMN-binding domain
VRRITMWILATICGTVLLFSYRTSTMGSSASAQTSQRTSGNTGATPAASGSADPSATAAATGTKTYKGSSVQTRWGAVQVQVTISNGKITDVTTLKSPNGNGRDVEINNYALPILKQSVISAQSANIDTISGATITSNGYIQSLQSALDSAHFKA